MSTSRGRRLALQQALGVAPRRTVSKELPSPLLQALEGLTASGARAELSKFLLARSADLETAVKQSDPNAARALVRAWEQVALDEKHAEQVLAWVGRLGKDRTLFRGLAAGLEPGKTEEEQDESLYDRVMTAVVAHAVRLLPRALEARFGGQRTANAKMSGALVRIFREFDAKSAFAEVAKLKPALSRAK